MFRFTIRDVLWLTVVVALGVGWWAERQAKEQAALRYEVARQSMQQAAELLGASLVALALAAPAAHAYQAGDMILRAGAITTAPNESSGDSSTSARGLTLAPKRA